MRFAEILGGLGLVGILYFGCAAKTPTESNVSALESQSVPVQQQLTKEEAAKLLDLKEDEIDRFLSNKGGVFISFKGGEGSDYDRLLAITGAKDGKVEVVFSEKDGQKYCDLKRRYDIEGQFISEEENQRRFDLFINTLREASGYDNVVTTGELIKYQQEFCAEEYKRQQEAKKKQETKQPQKEIQEEPLTE